MQGVRIHMRSKEIHGEWGDTESEDTPGKWKHTLEVKTHIGNEDTQKKWGHKRRVGIHMELGYIRKRDIKLIRRRAIHGVGIYTEWGYTQKDDIKLTRKGNTGEVGTYIGSESGDSHGEWGHTLGIEIHIGNKETHKKWGHKRGVGTHMELGYIRKGDIKLTRRRDTHGVEIYTKWGYTQKDDIKLTRKGNIRELGTYMGSGNIHREWKHT